MGSPRPSTHRSPATTITDAYSPSNLHEASDPKPRFHASQDRKLTTSVAGL